MSYIKLENQDTSVITELIPRPKEISNWYQEKKVTMKITINGNKKVYNKKYNPREISFIYDSVPLIKPEYTTERVKTKDEILNYFDEFTDYNLIIYDIPELSVTTEETFAFTCLTKTAKIKTIGNDNTTYSIEIKFIERL